MKRSSSEEPENPDCGVRADSDDPKLKGLSIKSKNKPQGEFVQNPLNDDVPLSQASMLHMSSIQTDVINERPDPPEHCAGGTLHCVQARGQPAQPSTQRTFIEVQLSSSPSAVLPLYESVNLNSAPKRAPVPSPDLSSEERTDTLVSDALCPSAESNSTTSHCSNPSNPGSDVSERPKSSSSRLYVKVSERQCFSTDCSPFSVRHKIKSFENLAHFDKPVAKSSESQSYALSYRASINQRIAGYMGSVNSAGCRTRQRSFTSYTENRTPVTLCSPLVGKPSSNLEHPHRHSPAAELPQTPPVLRRKHGRLPRSRLQQLRALSMPELEKLCTEDFRTNPEKTHTEIRPAGEPTEDPETERFPPTVEMMSHGEPGSTEESLQRSPEAGWSISLQELLSSPVNQHELQTSLPSLTARLMVKTMIQEAEEESFSEVTGDTRLVILCKEEGSGLGFSVAGGDDLEQRAVVVHRVFTKGAASLEGTIQSGDRLVSINGTSVEGKTHGEVVSLLHQSRLSSPVLVVIRRDKDSGTSVSVRQDSVNHLKKKSLEAGADVGPGGVLTVELQKTSAGLGFSVEGDRPLLVKRLFKEGAAELSELIQVGD
ncbi:PDZ domain-containing protein 2 [Solea senegalensis]|uniref:PDZ domain-containing protein 2 n=2 Tax=Solea senegalensis TaxID=28829 RepID=A0AAV6QD22_SOLSE|nr:PDZ domain-containing protein 2 [Solea senegalensis]